MITGISLIQSGGKPPHSKFAHCFRMTTEGLKCHKTIWSAATCHHYEGVYFPLIPALGPCYVG